jgi:type III secretion protein L
MSRRPEYLNLRPYGARWVNSPAVIKAAELAPIQRAADLLESANQEAQEILRLAGEEYEKQKQKGYDDGYKQASDIILDALVKENESFDAQIIKLQSMISDVVMQSVQKLVADFDDYEKVTAVVLASLQKMRGSQSIRILVAPEQIPHSDKIASMLREKSSKLEFIEVVPDASLSGSKVIVETPLGRLETSVDEEVGLMAHK